MKETCIATFTNEDSTKKAVVTLDYDRMANALQMNLNFEPEIKGGDEIELYANLAIKFYESLKEM